LPILTLLGVVEPFLFLSERQLGSGASPPKHCVLTSADPITLSRKSLEKLNESYKKPEQPIAVSRFLQSPPDGSAVNSEKLEEAAKGLPGLPVESLTDRSCGTLSLPWSGDLSGDLYHHTSMQMLTNWNDPISIPTAREEDARSISSSSPQNLRYSPYAHSSRAASVRSGASVASMWSSGSVKSWSSRISRKGRRRSAWGSLVDNDDQSLRPLVLVDEPKLKEISKARPFICTFDCGKAFASLSDWKRHEKAVHMPQDQWICNHPDVKMLPEVCPYDNSEFPSPSHMHAHQHDSCVYKRTEDRTFQRKDNLLQHLRIVHRVEDTTAMTKTIEAWRLPAQSLSPHDPALHCGFCGTVLPSWHDRVAHVGAHLKKGQKLTDWWEQRLDSTLDFAKMLIVPRV
jgi:hypothetical protein